MKLLPTRRLYRRAYRKLRVWVPLAVILLLVMVLFLPLSSNWMARRAEAEVFKATGLTVRVERLEATLAFGTVEIVGATIPPVGGSGESFRLDRVRASGSVRSLLAGGGRWPELIELDSPPPLEVRRTPAGGYALRGPVQTLVKAVTGLKPLPKNPAAKGAAPASAIGRTPKFILRNIALNIDSPLPGMPPAAVIVDSLTLGARASASSPVQAEIRGSASWSSTESFTIHVFAYPDQHRLSLKGDMTGLLAIFDIPEAGEIQVAGRGVELDVTGIWNPTTSVIDGALLFSANEFELAQRRIGGERWVDSPLKIDLQATYDTTNQRLMLRHFGLNSRQAEIVAEGDLTLTEQLPGNARVRIGRLPGAALGFGRGVLTDLVGLSVDAVGTSATLEMEAAVRGPFRDPERLRGEGSLRLAGWQLAAAELPVPIVVELLDLAATDQNLSLRDLVVTAAQTTLRARGQLPIPSGGETAKGSLNLTLSGDVGGVSEVLVREGLWTSEIREVRLPFFAQGAMDLTATDEIGTPLPRLRALTETLAAEFRWSAGSLRLRRLDQPLRIDPGEVALREGEANLRRLRATLGTLDLRLDAHATNLMVGKGLEDISADFLLTSAGSFQDLVGVLQQQFPLPKLPDDLKGSYRLDIAGIGRASAPEKLDYDVKLSVTGAGGTVQTPYRKIAVDGLATDLQLTTQSLAMNRLRFEIIDEAYEKSTVDLQARVTDAGVSLDGNLRSTFEFLTAVFARDLNDMVMIGLLPATITATLKPREALPPAPDLLRRWLALSEKEGLRVGISPEDDLIADFKVTYRQERPAEIYPREFPVKMTNIRSNAEITPSGIRIMGAKLDIGSARDVEVKSMLIRLGRPVRLEFDVHVPGTLDINEWTEGWGAREWASHPVSFPERWRTIPTSYQNLDITARITAKKARFMRFDGADLSTDFDLESWTRRGTFLKMPNLKSTVSGGAAAGDLDFEFRKNQRAWLLANVTFNNADMNDFMDRLYGRDQLMDGRMSAEMKFHGQLLNYPTYVGEADFTIRQSGVVGTIILETMKGLLDFTSNTGGRDSEVDGTIWMRDQKVTFPSITIKNPNLNIVADGTVDFKGRLLFDFTAAVISQRIGQVPLLGLVGDLLQGVGKELLSYQLRGTIRKPEYRALPGLVTRVDRWRTGEDLSKPELDYSRPDAPLHEN